VVVVRRVHVLLGLAWTVSMVGATRVRAQISPGPLARPHAQLEGALRCVTCHAGGKEQMAARCLDCHKEIAWLVQQHRGYHARQLQQQPRCAACHPDHAGREFALISWPERNPERFDHALAGWPLEGRHRQIKCADCHTASFRKGPAAALAPQPAAAPGWIGLEPTCLTCHADVHRRALGQKCEACHDSEHWAPAPKFDHARSDYPLTGKHRDVKCAECHNAPAGDTVPVFKPVAHRDCVACHADPHHGRFVGTCSKCHVTRGFAVIDSGRFNHDQTRYPLRGAHASVACAKCHDQPGLKTKNPPFAHCTDCHADPHAGMATLAGALVDCAACHTTAGFDKSGFSVAQHAQTKYPLEGKHRDVPCVSCHVKHPAGVPAAQLGSAAVLLRPAFGHCTSCHADAHGGQLARRPDAGDCSACHAVAGWTPSTFTLAAHAKTRFALAGRHAEIACDACHGADRKGLAPLPKTVTLGKGRVLFKLNELACASCHVDPHQGRFAQGGARPIPQGCLACHDAGTYRPSTIDVAAHNTYAFKLEGAHRAVPCVGCHKDLQYAPLSSTLVSVRWTGAPLLFTVAGQGCAACHQNPHGDQFAGDAGGNRCERCHGADAFSPASNFDHDRDTKFPLRGGHANVPCGRCHTEVPGPDHTRMVKYRPVATRCESCHGDGVRQ
jgi:Cytochrome c7 and related cytochrome c